jgi:ribosome modulation factor
MPLDEDMERYHSEGVKIDAAGYRAACRGEPIESNPYNPDHWDGQTWIAGWNAGHFLDVMDDI